MLVNEFLLLGAVLFCIGVYGVIARKNAVMVLMSIELILNSVNLNLLAFSQLHNNARRQRLRALHHRRRRRRGRRRPGDGAADLPQPQEHLARRALGDEGLSVLAAEVGRLVPRTRLADPADPGRRVRGHHPVRQVEINGEAACFRWAGAEVGIASMVGRRWCSAIGTDVPVDPPRRAASARSSSAGHQVVDVVAERRRCSFGIGEHIDGLAVMLLLLVTFISTLVQIYSLEYVRGDRRYTHFFAAITLFSAGMLTMVLAENMVQLILGWEIMGLCSFMLIGHWWEEEANARAAAEGVLHRARRRHRPAGRHGDHVRRHRARSPSSGLHALGATTPAHQPHRAAVGVGRAVHRLHRQERPVPAAHLVARRDGRPDARSARCCTRRRWSSPACSSSPASIPVFHAGLRRSTSPVSTST